MSKYIIKDDDVYTAGTLAQLLDNRYVEAAEPTVDTLPKTINPLKFLFNNLIVNNSLLVLIDQEAMNTTNEYLKLLLHLDYVSAPESCVLVAIKLSEVRDDVSVLQADDDANVVQELAIITDTIVNNTTDSVEISYNQRVCQ